MNKVLIRSIHRGVTLNRILPRPAGVEYPMLINVSSGYHNLKFDKQSSHVTTFSSPFGRYRYMTTIQCGTCWRYVPLKDRWTVPGTAKCVWHCWWHSNCRVQWHGQRPWCYTQGADDIQTSQSEAKQRQVSVQVYLYPILQCEVILQSGVSPNSKKGTDTTGHVTIQMQKGIEVIPRYTQLPE